MLDHLLPAHETSRARLLWQAGAISTIAAIIGFGVAISQAAALGSLISIFAAIIGPLAAFAPALAVLLIAIEDYGLTTRTSRAATFLVVSGGATLFVFAILAFFI
ncbi:hypothetical protein [Jannaschia sp. LMIT008]|uniref:hypothetical protein n=1 Tax=Jannaschia maritima TaxID=3032585 RepID=UPI002811A11F|nr:hypothetical protein [Jannaschia sp. LMIT008]